MKFASLFLPLAAACMSASAQAQSGFVPSVIGQTVMNSSRGSSKPPEPPEECYNGHLSPATLHQSLGQQRVDLAIQNYLKIAADGKNLNKSYSRYRRDWHWELDGVAQEVGSARDPWAAQNVRVERIAFAASNYGGVYRGLWRAFAADGSALGTYDGLLQWDGVKARFFKLDLFSAGKTRQPIPVGPFCTKPGDIEKWQEAKSKSAAEGSAAAH